MNRSRISFSSAAAARAAMNFDDNDDEEEEPGEVLESAPPLRVGEERDVNASGLMKKLLKAGSGWGTPVFEDEITVHYEGLLINGAVSDSDGDKGQLLTYKLGQDAVASGLDLGILTMKKGELALFTLPPMRHVNPGTQAPFTGSACQFKVELLSWLTVVDVYKDNGIVKKVLSSGDSMLIGDLDEVTVKYELRLLDGTVVAKTSEEGLLFSASQEHLFPAMPVVLKTMKRGEKATVTLKPGYAFGQKGREAENGFPAIPTNSELILDLELLALTPIVNVTGDLKVLKKILKVGEGLRGPIDGEVVRIRYTAMLKDGEIFERKGFGEDLFEFVIDEDQVISGLDRAVATMLRGEFALVTVKPEYGFSSEVRNDDLMIPEDSTLLYEVELVDFTKEKETYEMTGHEIIEAAEKMKQKGNELYKIGKFHRAAKKYDKALSYINEVEPFEGEEEKLVRNLRFSCWLNNAACCLKLNDFHGVIPLCSKVLNFEFCNTKALYRRAQAYIETGDLVLAELDIQKALEADPQNREVKSLQTTLKQRQAESNKRNAEIYANMLGRKRKGIY